MDWNPKTHEYCRGCSYYEAVGSYVYQLQNTPAKRKCKHLARCGRVAKLIENMELGVQLSLDTANGSQRGW